MPCLSYKSEEHIIIVAGGSGSRMGSVTPKQFLELVGHLLMHTLKKFERSIVGGEIFSIARKRAKHAIYVKNHFDVPHQIVNGGEMISFGSKCLQKVKKSIVAIHDGVRPLVSETVISNCMQSAEKIGAAIPTLPIHDSIRKPDNGSQTTDRKKFVLKTPVCFQSEVILKALNKNIKQFYR